MQFPDQRRFAFTILDDTDDSTLENVAPVYERLREYGFRTTKTVWPVDCPEGSRHYFAADTLQRPEYREFVRALASQGFEIALHGATMESSERHRMLRALEVLESELGIRPRIHVNHGENRENLYWGPKRFHSPGLRRLLSRLHGQKADYYVGDDPGSAYFWGDIASDRIDYVRNFTFRSLDLCEIDPATPYQLAATPLVERWFSTADAPDVEHFCLRVTPEAIDRLEEHGGACIVSTHLGKYFWRNGRIDPRFDAILRHIAAKPGWFVPVSSLLDHLREHAPRARGSLGRVALARLELRFLFDQLVTRFTSPSATYP
jgi:hypothetical protein